MSSPIEDTTFESPEPLEKTGEPANKGAETHDAGQLLQRLKTLEAETGEPIVEILKGSPSLITEVINYLTDNPDQVSLDLLKRLILSDHRDLALAAARVFGDYRSQAAVEAITEVLANGQLDKAVAKELRRSLHRLRSSGLAPAAVPQKKAQQVASKSQALPPYAALATNIDPYGDRLLHYVAMLPGGGLQLMRLLAEDTVGIEKCDVLRLGRKEWSEIKETFLAAEDVVYAEIDPLYCRQLIWEYADRNRQSGTPLPREFVLARSWLGKGEEHLPCPVYTYLPVEEISAQMPLLLPGSEALLRTKEMASWSFPQEPLLAAARELQERRSSPVWISELAKAEQEERIRASALENIMEGDFRQVFIRRLEETAYIFYLTGKGKESRQALAVAVALREGKKRLVDIPLLAAMLDQGLEEILEDNQFEQGGYPDDLWT